MRTVIMKDGSSRKLNSLLPKEYFDIYEKETIKLEHNLQEILVRYFRSFIQPMYENATIIANPFSESNRLNNVDVGRAKRVGFQRGQSDLIIVHRKICHNLQIAGVCLELKLIDAGGFDNREDRNPKNETTRNQNIFIGKMIENGFDASFSFGLQESLTKLIRYFE